MSVKEDIKHAIDEKNIISFNYNGHSRTVEPYHYGKVVRTPKDQPINPPKDSYLLCYQIGGTSKSGKMGYKTMDMEKIENLKIHKTQNFIVREDYDSTNGQWEIE